MKTINILILWVGLCTLAIADPITLTVDDAVQSALQNNISVKQSQIQLNGLKRAKNTSWNSVHPTIGVSFSGSFLMPDDARYDNPMQGYKQQYTLGGQINLALTPALYSAIKVACVNYENGKLTYDQAVRGIELKVRTAFYNILYQKEYIEVQKRNVETARTQYNQTRQRYQNGRASELDLLSSQVSYESQLPTIQSLELNFEKELATFKQMLGINQENEINLSGSLSDALVLKALDISANMSDMPQVKAAENSVKLAKAGLLARRLSAYGPVVSAGWAYGKAKSDKADSWSTTSTISLGVSLPLDGFLPWTAKGQTVFDAKDSVKQAELNLQNEKISADVQINALINQIKQMQAQNETLRQNVSLAEKSYNMMLNAYNHGTRDFLNLQTAQNSLRTARITLAQQEYALISTILNLEYLLGIPFGTLGKKE